MKPRKTTTRHSPWMLPWIMAFLMCMTGSQAQAQSCVLNVNTQTLDFGSLTVTPSMPVGTVLATRSVSGIGAQCTATTRYGYMFYEIVEAPAESTVPGVLTTPAAGIGVRITSSASPTPMTLTNGNGPDYNYIPWSGFTKIFHIRKISSSGSMIYGPEDITFELIKITAGPGQAQAIAPFSAMGFVALGYATSWDGSSPPGNYAIGGNVLLQATITTPTCSVNTPNQTVNLDTVYATQLSTLNATAGTKAFSIELVCQGGINLHTTLTDNSAPGNTTNVLTNSVAATQAGVGLQILRNGTPVNFGSAMFITSIASNGTPVNIPLEARYIRKAGALTTGNVNGIFTYTLTYQ